MTLPMSVSFIAGTVPHLDQPNLRAGGRGAVWTSRGGLTTSDEFDRTETPLAAELRTPMRPD